MNRKPKIITFANQKGGVGKTTLCVTFANYLFAKGAEVLVLDCDPQQSVMKRRKENSRAYEDAVAPYVVSSLNINDATAVEFILTKSLNEPTLDAVLIDLAGNQENEGTIKVLINSDAIVVPFHYDVICVQATCQFLKRYKKLTVGFDTQTKCRLFMVPNLYDSRVGTSEEVKLWELARMAFSRQGEVTANVHRRADMERINTIANLDRQLPIVEHAFDQVYTYLFGSNDNLREVVLSHIQHYDAKEERKNPQSFNNL